MDTKGPEKTVLCACFFWVSKKDRLVNTASTLDFGRVLSATDPLRVLTTGSFRVIQFNTRQKSSVTFGKVSKAAIHQKTELTFNFQSIVKKRSFGYVA